MRPGRSVPPGLFCRRRPAIVDPGQCTNATLWRNRAWNCRRIGCRAAVIPQPASPHQLTKTMVCSIVACPCWGSTRKRSKTANCSMTLCDAASAASFGKLVPWIWSAIPTILYGKPIVRTRGRSIRSPRPCGERISLRQRRSAFARCDLAICSYVEGGFIHSILGGAGPQ